MTIQVKPELEAILKAQVEQGHYPSVEAALEAAVLALAADPIDALPDVAWVKPPETNAAKTVAEGHTFSGEKVWAPLKERFSDQKR